MAEPQTDPSPSPDPVVAPVTKPLRSAPPLPAIPRMARIVTRNNGPRPVITVGQERAPWSDLYHVMLTATWWQLLGFVLSSYLGLNLVFAALYLAGGDCIANVRPGSLTDMFFFSVQTLATIGYGAMAPTTFYAHVLVTLEALVGMLVVAMTTGLMFAKFSRPTARLLFAEVAVVAPRNAVPHFMFRMANQRGNQIVEARVQAAVARNERTLEGVTMRRFHDLKMVRNQNIIFALTWTAMHEIDEQSPLYGETQQSMIDNNMEIIVSLSGMDDTMNQTVHARWSYLGSDIRWGHRYADIVTIDAQGRRVVNYLKFHDSIAMSSHEPVA